MASRRRLEERIAFASRAVHHHRLRRRPVLEVLEGRALTGHVHGQQPGG